MARLMFTKWDHYFMDVATRTAELSSCNRLKVGAVAVRDNRIICIGYNGTAAGEDNCCEDENYATKPNVIHAEDNLIRFAKKHKIKLTDSTIFITHSPCDGCATLIKKSGINKVVYGENYRSDYGLIFLKNKNITTIRYKDFE